MDTRINIYKGEILFLHTKRNLFISLSKATRANTFYICGKLACQQYSAIGACKVNLASYVVIVTFTGQFIYLVTSLSSNRLFQELCNINLHFSRIDYGFGLLYVAVRLMSRN